MAEWKDVALIIATYIALPGVLVAAYKTFVEIRKLREERIRERQSRIHAQQLEALRRLYERLDRVQGYSQLITKRATFEGEKTEEYPALLQLALAHARRQFVSARLLLPPDLVHQIEAFFAKVDESQIHLGVAQRAIAAGAQGAELWQKAGEISHQELPSLLAAIESSARAIIHGEHADDSHRAS